MCDKDHSDLFGKYYRELSEHIRANYPVHSHVEKTVWIIISDQSAKDVIDGLSHTVASADVFLVAFDVASFGLKASPSSISASSNPFERLHRIRN
jgi:hypothetical protein